ncbi:DNA-binding transcriptional MerR regulator [Catenuloplanes nepalensis]|uniref:DNA-binding transcriptional MerR regulator n=1 Tax=Catenuloplanes nepalensis TaxID=587533 RepID=A0ABT9MQY6_9ACTN|nr:MerR family transcriptional regulator [Catenuloplanes nepalensis]MDP9793446.1 DNA-binding transcriptional MerR regulator [Catenuloplanes nepalensis]
MRTTGGWSTRELARIAGTTVKTIRYYHRIGLLSEPERAANGYKLYRTAHLVRLLQIRRLVDLGVTLADVPAMEESAEGAEQVLRALDAELAASIERQQHMREELAAVLDRPHLAELPAGFGNLPDDLPAAERGLFTVSAQVFTPEQLEPLRNLPDEPRSAVAVEFDTLPADASDETRQSLAERFAPEVRRGWDAHPELLALAQTGGPLVSPVMLRSIAELFTPAQIDVLQRINAILTGG